MRYPNRDLDWLFSFLVCLALVMMLSSCSLLSLGGKDTSEVVKVTEGATYTKVAEQTHKTATDMGNSQVEKVTIQNSEGIGQVAYLISVLLLGIIIPRPTFIRKLFGD